jgi:hypothetical protein
MPSLRNIGQITVMPKNWSFVLLENSGLDIREYIMMQIWQNLNIRSNFRISDGFS